MRFAEHWTVRVDFPIPKHETGWIVPTLHSLWRNEKATVGKWVPDAAAPTHTHTHKHTTDSKHSLNPLGLQIHLYWGNLTMSDVEPPLVLLPLLAVFTLHIWKKKELIETRWVVGYHAWSICYMKVTHMHVDAALCARHRCSASDTLSTSETFWGLGWASLAATVN